MSHDVPQAIARKLTGEEQEAIITVAAIVRVAPGIRPYVTNSGVTGFLLPDGSVVKPWIVFELQGPSWRDDDSPAERDLSHEEAAKIGLTIIEYPTQDVQGLEVS